MDKFTFAFQANDSAYRSLKVHSDMDFALLPRFVLTWQDTETGHQQCLGDLSTERNDSPPCFFVLGMSSTDQLMLHIHLPLKINDTPKGMRNTYMIAPAESFDLNNGTASTDVLPITHDPREYPALCGTGVEAGAKLLLVRFVLKKPGYVLMPVGRPQKPVNERSQGLLLSLKSLSQAQSFELYVRDLEPNAEYLRSFLGTLCLETLCSPEINYKATFNSRPYGENAWKSYKLRDDETLPGKWNPIFDELPPSYEESVQSAPKQGEKPLPSGSRESADDGGEGPSRPRRLAAQELLEGNGRRNNTPEGPLEGSREQDGSPEAAVLQDTPQSDREVREESDETIIFDDRLHRDGNEHPVHASQEVQRQPQQDRHRKRNAHEAHLDAAPSSSRSGSTTTPGLSKERTTKVRKRVAFAIYDEEEEARHRACFEDEPARVLKETAVFHATSVLARGPNRCLFDEAQFRWFCDAVLWLATAWRRNHSVHIVYFEELCTLCRFIQRRDRNAFESTRLQCMVMFARKERMSKDEGPFACSLQDKTRWMINFIYHEFGPGHDTVVVDELTSLHESACHWMQVGGDDGPSGEENKEEYGRRENGFYFQMAACLLVACYLWERHEGNTAHQLVEGYVRPVEPGRWSDRARAQSAGP